VRSLRYDPRDLAITTDELDTWIIDACRRLGILVAHFRPARTTAGWRTPCTADAKGYPDHTLAGPGGTAWAETKSQRDLLRPEQIQWRDAILVGGGRHYVWRPSDWRSGQVMHVLLELSGRSRTP